MLNQFQKSYNYLVLLSPHAETSMPRALSQEIHIDSFGDIVDRSDKHGVGVVTNFFLASLASSKNHFPVAWSTTNFISSFTINNSPLGPIKSDILLKLRTPAWQHLGKVVSGDSVPSLFTRWEDRSYEYGTSPPSFLVVTDPDRSR